jgi:Glycine-rich domain-containing protein-like
MAQNPTWTDFLVSFDRTTAELKGARLLRALSRGSFFNSMRIAYMGILWRDFSIDLVAASLRQREFATKITSNECAGIDTPVALSNATVRYHKFLLLMKRVKNVKRKVALVPTLDIDLCWHTHQLQAPSYRKWCVEHLGAAINHDDTVGKDTLDTGLKETNAAWSKAYRESYTADSNSSKTHSFGGLFKSKKAQKESITPFFEFANDRHYDRKRWVCDHVSILVEVS